MEYCKNSLDADADKDNANVSFSFWLILAAESMAEFELDPSLRCPCYFNIDERFWPIMWNTMILSFLINWLNAFLNKILVCYTVCKTVSTYKISCDTQMTQWCKYFLYLPHFTNKKQKLKVVKGHISNYRASGGKDAT